MNESLPIFLDSAVGGRIVRPSIHPLTPHPPPDRWRHSCHFNFYGDYCCIRRVSHSPFHLSSVVDHLQTGSFHKPVRLASSAWHPIADTSIPTVCARYGLAIGAKSAPAVLAMMYLLSPLTWPIAQVLDWVLGKEGPTTYKKAELRSFLQFHRNPNSKTGSYTTDPDAAALPLSDEEIGILNGVLGLNDKKVTDIMTPIEVCYSTRPKTMRLISFLRTSLPSALTRYWTMSSSTTCSSTTPVSAESYR